MCVFPLVPSLTGHEEDEEQLRWSRLSTQISQKLITLKKVKEEHQTLISSEDGGTRGKVGKYGKTMIVSDLFKKVDFWRRHYVDEQQNGITVNEAKSFIRS